MKILMKTLREKDLIKFSSLAWLMSDMTLASKIVARDLMSKFILLVI